MRVDWINITCRGCATLLTAVTLGTAVIAAVQFSTDLYIRVLLSVFALVITALQIVFTSEAPNHRGMMAGALWFMAVLLTAISVWATCVALHTYYPAVVTQSEVMAGKHERIKAEYDQKASQISQAEAAEKGFLEISHKSQAQEERDRIERLSAELQMLSSQLDSLEMLQATAEAPGAEKYRTGGFLLVGSLVDVLRAVSLWLIGARSKTASTDAAKENTRDAQGTQEVREITAGIPEKSEETTHKNSDIPDFLLAMEAGSQVTIETFKSGLGLGYSNAKPHYEKAKEKGWIYKDGRTFRVSGDIS